MFSLPFRTPQLLALSLALSVISTAVQANESHDRLEAYEKLYPEISYQALKQARKNNEAFVVDANRKENYEKGHLPGAYSLSDREQLKLPFLKNYPVVVYCWSPECTSWMKGVDFFTANGYTNVMHYKGGVKEWMAKGDKLATGSNP
ncbi:hypothetical protein EOPP23_04460 [Endozoicomonas sp. OPT23]|uniref:rhodanese-like domain-containing protein n=1 Tax=Endozoicomonas sp. OPT23 TaxID=2072845 RepID=UPI00129C00D4|nr:rhodanese-like domain-containing protein [Endozoicomonas sp. OPT23]MRI32245.1 hypothetical protein [Endozoicomonas sp. OPT23]